MAIESRMYRLSALGKAPESLDQQAEPLPRRRPTASSRLLSPTAARRHRQLVRLLAVVVGGGEEAIVVRPQLRCLRRAARLEREHGAGGRGRGGGGGRVGRQLGGARRVEEPAVQVPRHVDGRAAVEEDGVAAAEVPPQPPELHDFPAVHGDPRLRVAVPHHDADLVLVAGLEEPRPRGPAAAPDEPLPAPRQTGPRDRYPAVQAVDVPAAEVAQQEHELGVGHHGHVEPGGRLGPRPRASASGVGVPRRGVVPEHAHHAAPRRERPAPLLLVQVAQRRRRVAGPVVARGGGGGGLVDGDGERRPVGRPRPRDVDE